MATFVAIYRGETVGSARLIGLSANPQLIADVSAKILEEHDATPDVDPIVACVDHGRRKALRLVLKEAAHANE